MDSSIEEIKKYYELSCNAFIKKFQKKQDYGFNGWIADRTGEIAVFIDQYFFNLSDIIHDLVTDQPKGQIFEWYDESMYKETLINYESYCRGLRYKTQTITCDLDKKCKDNSNFPECRSCVYLRVNPDEK